jgi:hypothetical protein
MTLSAIRDEAPNRRALSAGSPQRAVTDLGEERVSVFEDMSGWPAPHARIARLLARDGRLLSARYSPTSTTSWRSDR